VFSRVADHGCSFAIKSPAIPGACPWTAGHRQWPAANLSDAISATAAFRWVELRPSVMRSWRWAGTGTVNGSAGSRAGLEGLLPSDYTEAIPQVTIFGDPVITGSVTPGHWDHLRVRWTA